MLWLVDETSVPVVFRVIPIESGDIACVSFVSVA
jgi:hypothetical protein